MVRDPLDLPPRRALACVGNLLDMFSPADAMLSRRRDDTVVFTSLEPGGISIGEMEAASLTASFEQLHLMLSYPIR